MHLLTVDMHSWLQIDTVITEAIADMLENTHIHFLAELQRRSVPFVSVHYIMNKCIINLA